MKPLASKVLKATAITVGLMLMFVGEVAFFVTLSRTVPVQPPEQCIHPFGEGHDLDVFSLETDSEKAMVIYGANVIILKTPVTSMRLYFTVVNLATCQQTGYIGAVGVYPWVKLEPRTQTFIVAGTDYSGLYATDVTTYGRVLLSLTFTWDPVICVEKYAGFDAYTRLASFILTQGDAMYLNRGLTINDRWSILGPNPCMETA